MVVALFVVAIFGCIIIRPGLRVHMVAYALAWEEDILQYFLMVCDVHLFQYVILQLQ